MKTRQKRTMSLFLAVLMLFSVLPAGTMTASAATISLNRPLDKVYAITAREYYSSGSYHGAIDYGCPKGTPVYAAESGTVTVYDGGYGDGYSGCNDGSGWGNYIDITHSNGYKTRYAHMSTGRFVVKTGAKVERGQLIGYSGDSGNSSGPHLHFGLYLNGNKVYPESYIKTATGYNSGGPHTCSYSGSYFEAAHPHKVYQKCSCGKTKYTGATRAYQNCSTCMHLSWSYVMPVKAYTINTGKTTVYNAVNGTAKINKIYDTDLCTISQIYDCGWCKVTFPLDAGGTETGYCKIGVFMKSGGFYLYTSKQITTYRRSDLKTSNGYAGAGDKIYILGTAGSAVQIAYPLNSSTWKVGWVPQSAIKATVSYNANGGSGSMVNSSVQYNSSLTLSANKFTKTGYTFSGWNVYRSSDKKWYVSGQGWKTASEISKNGYTKKLYGNQSKYTFNCDWLIYGKTNDTFTFYAVWTPNKLSVNYNANGGTISSDTYKLSNNIVYKKSNNEKLTQTWTYNNTQTNGLYNASTFGLKRDGYTFKGWGTTASGGTIFDQNDAKLIPTSINSKIKNGNCTTTLYAIWEKKETPVVHAHEWNTDYTIDKEPTCMGTGMKSIHCKSCDETKNAVTIPMTEHSYSYVITKAATCSQEGIKEQVCSKCGLHNNKETIPMTDHELGEWVVEKEASASSDGLEVRKCENCDYTETRNIDYIPVYDEDAPRISMSSVNAKAGEEVEVQIKLENNPGITALRLVIDYDDTALEMTDFKFGDALASMNKGTSENYGNDYSFSMFSATADLTDCGTLAIIKFKVKEDAEDGEYPITITYDPDDIFNLAGDCVNFEMELGAVMVNSCLLGDVNNDGKINMRDVVLLQQVVNGWDVSYNKDATDYNGDGKTNMRDIVALQQYING